ncbi:MAG: hydrogenase maturation protease [Candidatus Omnitrophota bacterium]|jgi:hydrogenase maturation protease|nr:MAG: hydrogenase maturation protease [Candidatus Omnitrophota bacterium]
MSNLSKVFSVIGLGNTLRRDDGIGIVVLESLLQFYREENVDYLNFGTASFNLVNKIKDYKAVLLIDGIDAGLLPGELKIFDLQDICYNTEDCNSSTHELNLTSLFELSRKLGLKTKIYVAGIQVQDTGWGEGLSPAVNNNRQDIIENISFFIKENFVNHS